VKVYGEVAGRKFQRTNIIGGYCNGKILAPFQYEGTTDADLVEGWFEMCLLPVISKGSVIIMDNASAHKKNTLFDIVEEAGCTIRANASNFRIVN
jgi:transposase